MSDSKLDDNFDIDDEHSYWWFRSRQQVNIEDNDFDKLYDIRMKQSDARFGTFKLINKKKYIILRSITYDRIIKLYNDDIALSYQINSKKLDSDSYIPNSIYYIKINSPNTLSYLIDRVEFLGFEKKLVLEKHMPYDFEEKIITFYEDEFYAYEYTLSN